MLVTSPLSHPSAGRAGAPCGGRPASGPAARRRRGKENEREEETAGSRRRLTKGGAGVRRPGAVGEASAVLKVEGASDVQRVGSLAERTN